MRHVGIGLLIILLQTPSLPVGAQQGWSFDLERGTTRDTTVTMTNRCHRKHSFVTGAEEPWIQIRSESVRLPPGGSATVPLKFGAWGLETGTWTGTVTVSCQSCRREPRCTQDVDRFPVEMRVFDCAELYEAMRVILERIEARRARNHASAEEAEYAYRGSNWKGESHHGYSHWIDSAAITRATIEGQNDAGRILLFEAKLLAAVGTDAAAAELLRQLSTEAILTTAGPHLDEVPEPIRKILALKDDKTQALLETSWKPLLQAGLFEVIGSSLEALGRFSLKYRTEWKEDLAMHYFLTFVRNANVANLEAIQALSDLESFRRECLEAQRLGCECPEVGALDFYRFNVEPEFGSPFTRGLTSTVRREVYWPEVQRIQDPIDLYNAERGPFGTPHD